ncbi:MAG: hypothetical protein AAGH99_13635 [Planctomycetota bacterium]
MSRLRRYFDDQDTERIDATIAQVQAETTTEIVCVAAAASGRYDRAEDLFGLLAGIVTAGCVWLGLPDAVPGGDSWAGFTPTAKVACMAVALLIGFVASTVAASHLWPLRRPFIPRAEQRDNVALAASAVFFDQSLRRSSGKQRLLIYLSMDERRAIMLADEETLEAITPAALESLCRDLTALLTDTDPVEAICQTLRRLGEHLPTSQSDQAESETSLPNKLILRP